MFKKIDKAIPVVIIILITALFIAMLTDVYRFGVDDSFIFYRYAENAAAGSGFRFNTGEAAGEGFTSWLWMLLLTLCHFLGIATVPASKILGILFLLLSGGMLFLVVRKLMGQTPVATLTGLTLAAGVWLNFRLVAHGVSGMETGMYLFAVLALIYLTTSALLAPKEESRWWWILGAGTLVLYLVRPEGIVAGGISLAAFALGRLKDLLKPRTWGYLFFALILPLSLFLLMKHLVFGYIMPHSYYHKIIIDKGEYSAALNHLIRFLKSYWWLMVVSIAALYYGWPARKKNSSVNGNVYVYLYYIALFIAMTGLYLFFYPAMNYLHRFYIPYLPLLLLMLVPAFRRLDGILDEKLSGGGFNGWKATARLLVLILLMAGLNTQLAPTRRVTGSWAKMTDPAIFRARLGIIMKQLPAEVVVANAEMGVIPYYSGLTCIDMAGLTDPHIAHHGLSMSYLSKRNVDLIIFSKDVDKMTPEKWNAYTINYRDVFLSPLFKTRFRRIGSYAAWPGNSARYYLYADTGSDRFEAINRWRQRFRKEIKQ